jgi:hypothetical protein
MWRRVNLAWTDVSEEHVASIFRLLPATCSPFSTDPYPLLSIDFPCGPLPLPYCSYIAGCFRLVAQSAATRSRWFLARGFFYLEDGAIRSSETSVHTRLTLATFKKMAFLIVIAMKTSNLTKWQQILIVKRLNYRDRFVPLCLTRPLMRDKK